MFVNKKNIKYILFVIFSLLLVGCGPTAEELAVTYVAETQAAYSPTPAPTMTMPPTQTPYPTYTPYPTETPVPTKTPVPITDTPEPTETKQASPSNSGSGGSGYSSGCTGGGCHRFLVNNNTDGTGYITLIGEKESYYFVVPPGRGYTFSIYPGLYKYTLQYCGESVSGTHTLNSKWYVNWKKC